MDRVLDSANKFFLQPDEVKRAFSRNSFASSPNHGWVSLESERWDSGPGPSPRLVRTLFNVDLCFSG